MLAASHQTTISSLSMHEANLTLWFCGAFMALKVFKMIRVHAFTL